MSVHRLCVANSSGWQRLGFSVLLVFPRGGSYDVADCGVDGNNFDMLSRNDSRDPSDNIEQQFLERQR